MCSSIAHLCWTKIPVALLEEKAFGLKREEMKIYMSDVGDC